MTDIAWMQTSAEFQSIIKILSVSYFLYRDVKCEEPPTWFVTALYQREEGGRSNEDGVLTRCCLHEYFAFCHNSDANQIVLTGSPGVHAS